MCVPCLMTNYCVAAICYSTCFLMFHVVDGYKASYNPVFIDYLQSPV